MEILHIIPVNGTYIIPLANMLQRLDNENTHTFFVTTPFQTVIKMNPSLFQIRGLQCMPIFKKYSTFRKMRYITQCGRKADHIVWHTFKTNSGYNPFLLFLYPKLLRKSTWIPGEGEIGNYMSVPSRFWNQFSRIINQFVQHNVACIGVDFPSDYMELDENKIKSLVKTLPYPNNAEQNMVLNCCKQNAEHREKKKSIFVQIGLSSQIKNKHSQLIDVLSELPNYEKACVFVQFCSALNEMRHESGTIVYKNKVRSKAEQLNCKCIFKDSRLSPENYIKYLKGMDIVLLANDSSCQMHILFCLLAMNKRIFMPRESPLFQYLNECGANIYPLERLLEETLSAAMTLSGTNLPQQLEDYYTEEKVMEHWRQWYTSLSRNNG